MWCIWIQNQLQNLLSNSLAVNLTPVPLPYNRNHVRFPTHELDCIGDVEKIPGDFTVTVNFARSDGGPVKRTFPDRKSVV